MPWRHLNCGKPQRTETVYSDTWSAHQEQKPYSLSSSIILLLLCLHQHCIIFPEVFCLIVHYRTFPKDPSPLRGITWTESLLVRIFESEKAMAPHSSPLAWKIPRMEEPGRLQSMGSWRLGHNWATSLSLFTFMHWRRKWQPTPCSCLENPRDGGAWWAAIYGVTQSQTWLKWLSSRSSIEGKAVLYNVMIH